MRYEKPVLPPPRWRVWHGPPGAMVQVALLDAANWSDAFTEAHGLARAQGFSGRVTVTLATEFDPT